VLRPTEAISKLIYILGKEYILKKINEKVNAEGWEEEQEKDVIGSQIKYQNQYIENYKHKQSYFCNALMWKQITVIMLCILLCIPYMYEFFFTVNTAMNKINNTSVCFT
jgi:hypothetical protein